MSFKSALAFVFLFLIGCGSQSDGERLPASNQSVSSGLTITCVDMMNVGDADGCLGDSPSGVGNAAIIAGRDDSTVYGFGTVKRSKPIQVSVRIQNSLSERQTARLSGMVTFECGGEDRWEVIPLHTIHVSGGEYALSWGGGDCEYATPLGQHTLTVIMYSGEQEIQRVTGTFTLMDYGLTP